MKKLFILTLISLFCLSALAYASDMSIDTPRGEEIPLTATASSRYLGYAQYDADKAVDGVHYTYWIGNRGEDLWWIMFDAGSSVDIGTLNIKWYYSPYTMPTSYDIQTSDDAINWQDTIVDIAAENDQFVDINTTARYIRIYIDPADFDPSLTYGMPMMSEVIAHKGVNIPQTMRFQGALADSEGAPLNGTYSVEFNLYSLETAGTPIWTETHPDLIIEDGVLDVELGAITALDLPFDIQYYLGVTVASDNEMAPRFKLTSTPYSFAAKN